ncbi:MAG TPA: response regulator [Adhaeribacter sp.]|nr:response regulator [Adhaeribacter sp.]
MLSKIYIVDDDEISIFITEAILEEFGYLGMLESYLDPVEAFNRILGFVLEKQDGKFLIFLDLNMPGISGWEFLDRLSEYEETLRDRCFVVILSSAVDGREILKSTQYSLVLNFVPKPLDETSLALVLELLYERSTSENE